LSSCVIASSNETPNDGGNLSIIRKDFCRERKKKKKNVGEQETENRDEEVRECAPAECAVHSPIPFS
jgi:hypothetical protein